MSHIGQKRTFSILRIAVDAPLSCPNFRAFFVPITVQDLLRNPELCKALATHLDFRLLEADETTDRWFQIEAPESFVAVAQEGAGGRFMLGQSSGAVLYISSEGYAGVVAASLPEFLALLATHPYWQDLLKFSGGGNLVEMHRSAALLRPDASDLLLDAKEAERLLRPLVTLPSAEVAIDLLHRAMRDLSASVHVTSLEGDVYEGLFNSFTSDSLIRVAGSRDT